MAFTVLDQFFSELFLLVHRIQHTISPLKLQQRLSSFTPKCCSRTKLQETEICIQPLFKLLFSSFSSWPCFKLGGSSKINNLFDLQSLVFDIYWITGVWLSTLGFLFYCNRLYIDYQTCSVFWNIL